MACLGGDVDIDKADRSVTLDMAGVHLITLVNDIDVLLKA